MRELAYLTDEQLSDLLTVVLRVARRFGFGRFDIPIPPLPMCAVNVVAEYFERHGR